MSAPAAPAAHALDAGRSIVGRERELEVLVAWIDRGDMPQLTLTGEAGIGRTVLTEVAVRHAL
jgi:ATP-dependent Clp protease ATP-binding subunit ClpA